VRREQRRHQTWPSPGPEVEDPAKPRARASCLGGRRWRASDASSGGTPCLQKKGTPPVRSGAGTTTEVLAGGGGATAATGGVEEAPTLAARSGARTTADVPAGGGGAVALAATGGAKRITGKDAVPARVAWAVTKVVTRASTARAADAGAAAPAGGAEGASTAVVWPTAPSAGRHEVGQRLPWADRRGLPRPRRAWRRRRRTTRRGPSREEAWRGAAHPRLGLRVRLGLDQGDHEGSFGGGGVAQASSSRCGRGRPAAPAVGDAKMAVGSLACASWGAAKAAATVAAAAGVTPARGTAAVVSAAEGSSPWVGSGRRPAEAGDGLPSSPPFATGARAGARESAGQQGSSKQRRWSPAAGDDRAAGQRPR
jgi:hypothetical protein